MSDASGHSLSIIIEWDNVRISELGRAKAMLARLGEQLHDLHTRATTTAASATLPTDHLQWFVQPVELLVGYNDAEIDPNELAPIVRDFFNEAHANAQVTLLRATDANYYRLKNTGVRQAKGDLIVFVDSDVIPEDGWLEQLVQPFSNPHIKVVGGNTYVEPNSLYSRTLALTFFFPLRADDGPLHESDWFFANNCAFRKSVLLQHPFPERTDQFRGQCDELARAIIASGHKIMINPRARVHHPPPNGVRHFINRAVCEGHDYYLEAVHNAGRTGERTTLRKTLGRTRRRLRDSLRRIRRQRDRVGLSAAGVPVAAAIATSYYSFYLMGEILGRTSPQTVRKFFSI
jgi:glycosyltransferase involved in cell wall biosynthesis